MIPAVIWRFHTGSRLSGCVLLVFTLMSMTIDNILRPTIIRKGANLPLLLIFTGVIGGMIGMGIMGIFLGPVILAVTYNLLAEWVGGQSEPEADAMRGLIKSHFALGIVFLAQDNHRQNPEADH